MSGKEQVGGANGLQGMMEREGRGRVVKVRSRRKGF